MHYRFPASIDPFTSENPAERHALPLFSSFSFTLHLQFDLANPNSYASQMINTLIEMH